eukprot:scaffold1878_cov258-Pinguiococcus_pyrenoidosus.AAC.31
MEQYLLARSHMSSTPSLIGDCDLQRRRRRSFALGHGFEVLKHRGIVRQLPRVPAVPGEEAGPGAVVVEGLPSGKVTRARNQSHEARVIQAKAVDFQREQAHVHPCLLQDGNVAFQLLDVRPDRRVPLRIFGQLLGRFFQLHLQLLFLSDVRKEVPFPRGGLALQGISGHLLVLVAPIQGAQGRVHLCAVFSRLC